MKKLMLIITAALMSSAVVFAQAPDNVKNTFSKNYPNTSQVYWKNGKDKDTYIVSYTDAGNVEHKICYDKNGNIKHEKTALSSAAVPSSISSYYSTRTSPGDNYKVWEVKDNTGQVTFYVSDLNGKMTYFTKDGTVTTRQMANDDMDWKDDSKMPIDK